MIRLLITQAAVDGPAIALRLMGATIEMGAAPFPDADALARCDAVVYFGLGSVERGEVEHLLRSGKHVLLTAPPHPWTEALWETARQHDVQLLILNTDRVLPSRQLIKQMLPDKIGQAGLIRLHHWSSPTLLNGEVPLRDLDTALWLTDRSPDCVYALGQDDGRFLQIHLGFPGGGMALIDRDCRLPKGDDYRSLSVIGSSGAAYADDQQNMQLLYRGGHAQAVQIDEGIKPFVAMMQTFVDAIQTNHDYSANAAAWHEVFAIAAAVEESLRTRQAVHREGR